jgi:uncharacterized protein YaaN involved in tellurite resistance
VKRYGEYGRKASWIVKRYEKYGRKISWIVKRFEKYRRKLWNDMENMDEMWNDMDIFVFIQHLNHYFVDLLQFCNRCLR